MTGYSVHERRGRLEHRQPDGSYEPPRPPDSQELPRDLPPLDGRDHVDWSGGFGDPLAGEYHDGDRHDEYDDYDQYDEYNQYDEIELIQDGDESTEDRARRLRRAVQQAGLAVAAGLCIWLVATAVSPTTLTDTTDLPDDAATSASGDTDRDESSAADGSGADGEATVALEAVGTVPGATGETTAAEGTVPDGTGRAAAADGTTTDGTTTDGTTTDGTTTETTASSSSTTGSTAQQTGSTAQQTASRARQTGSSDYRSNLALLQRASVRNRNHDGSPYQNTPSASLVPTNHYGPRSEYLGNPNGSPENAFPVVNGGQFRAACEFSHFSYDDPLVFPGKPGASHLHMHFGNTHLNAFSTYDTVINSGSSTCNGQELNRTAYWVPAMFDGEGNVRVPQGIVIYYKGEGLARGASEVYPEGAAMIADYNLNTMPSSAGGIGGAKMTFVCSDNFSTNTGNGGQTMPACSGSAYGDGVGHWTVLEMSLKFPQCWNGRDPSDWKNFQPPSGDWYVSRCTGEFTHTLPNLEYFVNYRVYPGENTRNWFLSSDVDPTSFGASKATGGSTIHGDWWGGWHKATNKLWIDNCVNFRGSAPSGCGRGYLTDGGPNGSAPYDGPALKMRPQYDGPHKVPAKTLLEELCPSPRRSYAKPEDAAYCAPGTGL